MLELELNTACIKLRRAISNPSAVERYLKQVKIEDKWANYKFSRKRTR